LRQGLALVVLALVPAIGQAVYYGKTAPWQAPAVTKDEVTLEQAREWGDSVLWLDARPMRNTKSSTFPARFR